jgi:hypothetical protein
MKTLERTSKRGRINEGRPSKYSKKLGKTICYRLSKGESLLDICEEEDYPAAETVYRWLLREDLGEFRNSYERARATQAEIYFERLDKMALLSSQEIVGGDDKADNARVQARRLQVDTLKWRLSKMLPKKYGDKLDLTSGGEKLPQPILQLTKQVIHEQLPSHDRTPQIEAPKDGLLKPQ